MFARKISEWKNRRLAQSLCMGQRNIDRMKMETHQTVSMLIGMITQILDPYESMSFSLKSAATYITWEVRVVGSKERGSRSGPRLAEISCIYESPNGFRATYDSKARDAGMKNVHYVQLTHESLHVLVGGLCQSYPALVAMLEPYMKATKKQF